MAEAKYRSGEYRTAERQLTEQIASQGAWCAEDICLMGSRLIAPGTPRHAWHVAHDPSGTRIIGASHRKCNASEGATRGNRMRGTTPTRRRWAL